MQSVALSSASSAKPATTSTSIPFLDLKAQYATIQKEVLDAVGRVLESQHFILGSEVEKLEAEIAAFVGTDYAVSCASGSDALLLTLMALGIEAGDEVITTPFTFGATVGSIARLKAKPVFVDIDPQTYNIDVTKVEPAITSHTRAILPVHLFGQAADMGPLLEIAARHNLPVIEDAAQAIGAKYDGKAVGTLGNFGCFSFFPSKNLGGAGDGGIITTNHKEAADRLRALRMHGCRKKYQYELIGMNSRLDALQAAILRVKLRYLPEWTDGRQRNAERYRAMFSAAGLNAVCDTPACSPGCYHVYNQFTVRVANRDELRQYVSKRGVPTEVYYPYPLHTEPAYTFLGYKAGDFPEAEAAAKSVVSLPIYPELTGEQQQRVVDAIGDFFAETSKR